MGLIFRFIGPGGGDRKGVGNGFRGVRDVQNWGDTGAGGGRQMGGSDPGHGAVAGFPPAKTGERSQEGGEQQSGGPAAKLSVFH